MFHKKGSSSSSDKTQTATPTPGAGPLPAPGEKIHVFEAKLMSGVAKKKHTFSKARAFVIPTQCAVCGDHIWGVTKSGFSCSDCGFPVHKRCLSKVPENCDIWVRDMTPHKSTGGPSSDAGNLLELSADALPEFSSAPDGLSPDTQLSHSTYDNTPRHSSSTVSPHSSSSSSSSTPPHSSSPSPSPPSSTTTPTPIPGAPVSGPGSPNHPSAAPGGAYYPGPVMSYQQQQQYPPQQQYPHSPYGAHPSYGAPPPPSHGGYGAPPPSHGGYGAPPPHGSYQSPYGAPPPSYPPPHHQGGYGAPPPSYPPPPHHQGGYGAPPQGYGGHAPPPDYISPAALAGGFMPGPPPVQMAPPGPVIPRFGRPEPIGQFYEIGEVLGKGAFSEVRTCTEMSTGRQWAVKIMKKNFRDPVALEVTSAEIGIYKSIGLHKNIVQLHDIFENDTHWFLVLQKITGGELLHRITKLKSFTERDASEFAAQMLHGIEHMHKMNIVHRDLKPENLLLSDDSEDADILLTDFGLSKQLGSRSELIFHPVGTPGYLSPELVDCMQKHSPYGMPCDMWAAGVIVYIMLCGFPPFWGSNNNELFEKITRGHYGFPAPYWSSVSDSAKHFIVHLLQLDPNKRYTVEQALQHPWIANREKLQNIHLTDATIQLQKFNARRRFRKAVQATLALGKMRAALTRSGSDFPPSGSDLPSDSPPSSSPTSEPSSPFSQPPSSS